MKPYFLWAICCWKYTIYLKHLHVQFCILLEISCDTFCSNSLTDTFCSNSLTDVRQGSNPPLSPLPPFGLDNDQKPVDCLKRREGMLKLSKWLLHHNGKMMTMMIYSCRITQWMLYYRWSNMVFTYYNFVYLLWTLRKKITKVSVS